MADVTQLAEQKQSFSTALSTKLDSVSDALPKDFNKARFVQNSIALLNDNPGIAKYGQQQIIAGLLKGSYLGLDFFNKEAYLVPYGESLTYQTSYKGKTKLIKKYSIRPVKDVYSFIVREGDDFKYGLNDGKPYVTFNPMPFGNGNITGAFAACVFENGELLIEAMSLAELENTRSSSKAKNSPAWSKFTTEMYRKTVIHRLCKHIDLDFENPTQRATFDEDMEIETDTQTIIENKVAEEQATVPFDDGFDGVEDAEVRDAE